MIYWFTGQPGHGKTTLAKALRDYIELNENSTVFHIDGDDLRNILTNKDYSQNGRENNIRTAQSIAVYLNNNGYDVVVSLVSPYKELREEFKSKTNVTEIYVHTTEERGRESFHVIDYERPTNSYIDIDTTGRTVEDAFNELLIKIENYDWNR